MTFDPEFIFDRLKVPVFLVDADGYLLHVTQGGADFFYYTREELQGRHLSAFYPGNEEAVKVSYELSQAARNGRYESEGWRLRKDGSSFWAASSIEAIKEGGSVVAFVCMIYDLSARKKRELELRASEENYRMMVEGVREYAIFMLSAEGVILTWNEGGRRIKGYLPDEVIGRNFSMFYSNTDINSGKPKRDLGKAVENGEYEEEGWRLRKDGSLFWANIVITPLYNSRNVLLGFSKVTRDLSERRENEERLRQSEERYRSLVSQVADYGIFLMDEQGRISSWNEGARRINGYTETEILGRHFSVFYPEEDIVADKPATELRIARERGKYEEEGWRLKKDGSRFWASVVITAVYNSNGTHIGYSKVTRDLTERKEAERALRDSTERYRQLAAQLQTTNQELSAVNTELEQFTSVASHDLQEPLRTVSSFLQLIERKLDKTEQPELHLYITKSINAAARMRDLIHNLLRYTQLGKTEMSEERVDVRELLSEMQQNLRLAIENSNATLIIRNELSYVTGDRLQLLQLIQNLVSNALKFTDKEKAEIRITCVQSEDHPLFAVADNGIGIREKDLGSIFEIFKRLHTKQDYPGSGIGLAICKKIVERHKGRIWVESVLGEGATFYFTLNEFK